MVPAPAPPAPPTAETGTPAGAFAVHLEVFSGPFDLLLRLIAKSQLDVTEVALAKVTDEFLAHLRARGDAFDLGEASEFLVVAATLLDLKAARLLPRGEVEDEEDLARLEARDLLFARLMAYRAYRQAAEFLAERMVTEGHRFPRAVSLEPRYAELLPEVLIGLGATQFAALAARALAPKPAPVVATGHLHLARVSVAEQVATLAARLRTDGVATFQSLTADCPGTLLVVARFLALLDLYRDGDVRFDQLAPLGSLTVSWTGRPAGGQP
jgi:segregation and condensation protein A